jgi:hypothetical protein
VKFVITSSGSSKNKKNEAKKKNNNLIIWQFDHVSFALPEMNLQLLLKTIMPWLSFATLPKVGGIL